MRPEDFWFIIIGIVVVVGAVWMYAKFHFVRYLMFIYHNHKSGPSGFFTIATLRDIIVDMLKEQGIKISNENLHIVHSFGHKYEGTITVKNDDGEEKLIDMDITADDSGNIRYEILG